LQELITRINDSCSGAGIDVEIVIVDDNSPDGTADFAEGLADMHNIKVVRRAGKLGLSSAVIDGFSEASSDTLLVIDADLSHPPEKIPEIISKLESGEADMVIGSRHVKGGSIENWPFYRRIISKGATLLARGLTKVKDPMSGFFAIKRAAIDGVVLNPVGYKIGLEILVKGNVSQVVEIPISFANRKAGKSKLGRMEYLKYIDHVITLYEHRRLWLAKYLKFAFVGGIGTILNLIVFWISVEIFFTHFLWASVIAFCVGATNNYILNRYWTFRSKGKIPVQYTQFMIISVAGLLLNLILLWGIVKTFLPALGIVEDKASLILTLAQFIAIFLVSIINFIANSVWTFSGDMKRK